MNLIIALTCQDVAAAQFQKGKERLFEEAGMLFSQFQQGERLGEPEGQGDGDSFGAIV